MQVKMIDFSQKSAICYRVEHLEIFIESLQNTSALLQCKNDEKYAKC